MTKTLPSFTARLCYFFSVTALIAVILHGVYTNFLLRDTVKNAPSNASFITESWQSSTWNRDREFVLSKRDITEIKTIIYQQFYFGPIYVLFTLGLIRGLYFLVKGGMFSDDAYTVFDSYMMLCYALGAWLVYFTLNANTDLLHYITLSPISDLFLVPRL